MCVYMGDGVCCVSCGDHVHGGRSVCVCTWGMECVWVCGCACTCALFCPLLISDLLSDFKLKN